MVYLYDPQPKTVSKAEVDLTMYSLRYILSKDAKPGDNEVLTFKVDAEGNQEMNFSLKGTLYH